jgi:hypothetical protein
VRDCFVRFRQSLMPLTMKRCSPGRT